jgi:hypothetical protein
MKEKSAARACVWHIFLSLLLTFVAMALSAFLVSSVLLKNVDNPFIKNLVTNAIMAITYAVSFYKFHQTNRIITYAKHPTGFDVKAEILAYLRGEGKYMCIFYAVCALLKGIFRVIPASFVSLFGMIAMDILLNPFANMLYVPVLSEVLAFVYACALLCLLVVIRSRKILQEFQDN